MARGCCLRAREGPTAKTIFHVSQWPARYWPAAVARRPGWYCRPPWWLVPLGLKPPLRPGVECLGYTAPQRTRLDCRIHDPARELCRGFVRLRHHSFLDSRPAPRIVRRPLCCRVNVRHRHWHCLARPGRILGRRPFVRTPRNRYSSPLARAVALLQSLRHLYSGFPLRLQAPKVV